SGRPTRIRLTESSFSSVASAAGTTVSGPRSPPIASRAIVTLRLIESGWDDRRGNAPPAAARGRALLLVGFLRDLDDFPAPVVSVGGHVMSHMGLARRLIDGECRPLQGIMGTTHATPRRRLARFLHSHFRFSDTKKVEA